MGFHQPLLLWFLLLGLIPVIILLLMRLRVKRIRWGAVYVLQRALARLEEEEKWKYYALLASRIAVALLLAFAFARPFLQRRDGGPLAAGNLHHVILVDNTYSMTGTQDDVSVYERGMRLLRSLVERWPRGELVSIYTLADGLQPVLERGRIEDGQAVLDALAGVEIRDGVADTARAIRAVRRRCAGEDLELILLSDGQRLNWVHAEDAEASDGGRAIWLRPGPEPGPNLALKALVPPGETIVKGSLVRVTAHVQCTRNARDAQAVTCELVVPGQGRLRRSATILPGQTREISFDVRLHETGNQVLRAELKTHDGIEWDDRMTAAVTVRDDMRMTVYGDVDRRAFENAIDFMCLALPRDAEDGGLQVVEGTDAAWPPPADTDVVVIDNPVGFDAARLTALRDYVRAGGGLVVFCGPGLASGGFGAADDFWPLRLASAPRVLPPAGAEFWSVQLSTLEHPAFEALETQDADGLSGVRVYGYWPAELNEGADAPVRFDNGDIWLAGRRLGFGRVLVFTSGLSGIWNNLPVRGSFVHMLYRTAAYAAEGGQSPMNVARGDPVLSFRSGDAATILTGPIGQGATPVSHALGTATRHGRAVKQYAGGLDRNGLYVVRTLETSGAVERFVAVYDDRAESEVLSLDPETEALLVARYGWRVIREEADLARLIRELTGGREIYVWVVGALLFLLFAESWLSWKVGS